MDSSMVSAQCNTREEIFDLKDRYGAAILAHEHQENLITECVADFSGDLLSLAGFAGRAEAETLVVCGARFVAETVKLLCPDKRVLLACASATCVLADSITPADVRRIRSCCPGVPVIAYVNSSAAVKAEADICCTVANAIAVASSFSSGQVILLPDRQLAELVALATDMEVIAWRGRCADHTLMRPCSLCPTMSALTLEDVANALRESQPQIEIEAELARRARRPLLDMLSSFP